MKEHQANIKPNPQQKEAIEHPPGPLMILAGAGTGKTFTLEKRIIYLIENYKVDPSHILSITYTEKAASELKTRIINKIGNTANSITVNTFHSFCLKILRDYSNEPLPQLFDESEAIHLLLKRFDEFKFKSDEFPLNPQKAVIESFIPFFNRIRDELIDPTVMDIPSNADDSIDKELSNQLNDLKYIYPIFQKWKKELNVMDYGDIILSAYHMLSTNKIILQKVIEQYHHIVVDEFQDNNFALNEMVGLITGDRQFITVVGDDDQVIYSFRGANSYNIRGFEKRYKHNQQYKSINLEENFRSTQPILDIANASIVNNIGRIDKTLISALSHQSMKPIRFWGEEPEQLDFLIKEILYLTSKNYNYKDISILCRTHSKVKLTINALQAAGIPVKPKWPGFFQIPDIRTILAWSSIIGRSSNQDHAFYRIIKQRCGYKITHTIFNTLDSHDRSPVFDRIAQNNFLLEKYQDLKSLVKQIIEFRQYVKKQSAGELLWKIVTYLGILKKYSRRYTIDDHFIMLNVGDLLNRAQIFSKRNQKNHSLKAFNTYIDAIMNSKGLPSIIPPSYRDLDAVIVNTVHGVKGGEFPIVFLPFQRANSFPMNPKPQKIISAPPDDWIKYSNYSDLTNKEHHYQEERRLFYVAITRAKEMLYFLAPSKATSRFIKELPDSLMEDHIMSITKEPTYTYSKLKTIYEQKLQKALYREDYNRVKSMTDALSIIAKHESGENYSLGKSDWEMELMNDLKVEFQAPSKEKIQLSASAIETYEQCPMKFRLGRVDGIPQTASKPELIFGNIIHKVLQRFHEPNKILTEERILRLLDEEWKNGEFDYSVREEKFKEQGKILLERYCALVIENPPNVLLREEKFTFDIGHITIRGAIDRIDKLSDGTEIIDYKTSKTSSPAKSNLQLAIYSMYLEQLNDEKIGGIPLQSSLYFLRDEKEPMRGHVFTSNQIGKTKEKIIDVAAGIQSRKFEAKTGFYCDWCDYKNLVCPAWEE